MEITTETVSQSARPDNVVPMLNAVDIPELNLSDEEGLLSDTSEDTENVPPANPVRAVASTVTDVSRPTHNVNTNWVLQRNLDTVQAHYDKFGRACPVCRYECTTRRRRKIHICQHFFRFFCKCGFNSVSRDMVYRHQKLAIRQGTSNLHGGEYRTIYKVDKESFGAWKKTICADQLISFLPAVPHNGHSRNRTSNQRQIADVTNIAAVVSRPSATATSADATVPDLRVRIPRCNVRVLTNDVTYLLEEADRLEATARRLRNIATEMRNRQ